MSKENQVIVERMIDAKELARLLGLNRDTVKKMAASGEIPSYRGKGESSPYRFLFSEVKAALANSSSGK